jgi:2-keto-4-pentenoate hydratase/2-oxohepta-3-ene-1,7-dioic acid hydratase in catechol pathway
MQFVTYKHNGEWTGGVEQDGVIVNLSALSFEHTVKQLLLAGPNRVNAVLSGVPRILKQKGSSLPKITDVELGPPISEPDKIIGIGLNYRDHAEELNAPYPEVPVVFSKYRNSLVGTGGDIQMPEMSQQIDYEGELAVVIGRRARKIAESEALQYVGGYSIFNDVTARDLQFRSSQWTMGKTLDSFAPMGPGLIPAEAIPNPQALEIVTRLNGEVVQQGHTENMIFSVGYLISYLSQTMTLEPGDIIATGTPAGVGFKRKPPRFLKAGDVIEVEIPPIGKIRNQVVDPTKYPTESGIEAEENPAS